MLEQYVKKILTSRVYDVAVETPLQSAGQLSKRLGNQILLKREDLANNLRMNWDMVRDVVAAEDGMPVEIAVPVENQGGTPMVTSIPPELQ